MKFLHKLPEQAVRIVVVFIVLAAVLFVVRQFIIPPEMKDMTLIRAATMEREADKEIKYAGAAVCSQCHEKQQEVKKTGYHRDLSCESCHGAAQKHVDNPTEVKADVTEKTRLLRLLPFLQLLAADRLPPDQPGNAQPAEALHHMP